MGRFVVAMAATAAVVLGLVATGAGAASAAPVITISPTTLPDAMIAQAYGTTTLTADGGVGPYVFTVTQGSVPSGMTLRLDGVLTGTPTGVGGPSSFEVTATDADRATGSAWFSIVVRPPLMEIVPNVLTAVQAGSAYAQTFTTLGAQSAVSYSLTSGTLPPGLTLSTGGHLGGTPTQAGTYAFSITATDAVDYTVTQSYFLTVAAPVLSLAPAQLPAPAVHTAYLATFTTTGGTAPYTYRLASGSAGLPPGLALSPAGVLSGTPIAGGTFDFTIVTTDSTTGTGAPFTASRTYTVVVPDPVPPLVFPGAALPDSIAGVAYSQQLTATGGTAPYSFAVAPGSTLPAGLTLTAGGGLAGSPATAGDASFDLTVTGVDAHAVTSTFTLHTYSSALVAPSTAVAGGAITLSGEGFAPGTYEVVLHSDPVVLGTVAVGSDGTLNARFTLPASTPAGAHELVLSLDGVTVSTSALTVTAAVGPVPSPGPSPTASAASAGAGLAATGSVAPLWLGGAALALLVAGGAVTALRRRLG